MSGKADRKPWQDKAVAVRDGEALDLARLEPFLQEQLGLSAKLRVKQFPGGFSNLTYLLTMGKANFVLRRAPFGVTVKSAHDMSREYRVLSALHPVYPKAPKPLLFCADEGILGLPFYLMEQVQGIILRAQMPPEMQPDKALMRAISQSLINALADLHQVDYQQAGLADLGQPEGYVFRQIEGWTKRYKKAQTDAIPGLDEVAGWLSRNLPESHNVSLIHNDFKYDNVVLDPSDWTRIIAVLDWEMCTIGDPLMDLGSSLGYWVEAKDPAIMQSLGLSSSALPGNLTRKELLAFYEERRGIAVKNPVFYYVYGLFKVAVIVQQIYARYQAGFTKDARFANLISAVKACAQMAEQAIEKDSL